MRGAPRGVAIVNRSFWPQSQVIGEGLLRFAELVAKDQPVTLITQSPHDLKKALDVAGRGDGLTCHECRARTTSASALSWRMLEAVSFMCWVMISLIRTRPAKVYVSTDPPVVVPFIVALYCWLWRVDYVYHLQDIHPEAANIVLPLNRVVFRVLRALDNFALSRAQLVVTLSSSMRTYLQAARQVSVPIELLDNPAVHVDEQSLRDKDIVYCGNAGRLQRMPLVMAAIQAYADQGGSLRFSFAGGGVHAADLQRLAAECPLVDYHGVLPARQAAELINAHRWALLPIDDEVTRYAFPSKSSAYALSGARILAICGEDTAVAEWVTAHHAGVVCAPDLESVVACFKRLERAAYEPFVLEPACRQQLSLDHFAQRLAVLVISS